MKAEAARERNLEVRSLIKTLFKKAETAIKKKSEDMASKVKEAVSYLDKAVSKGIIHKKTAARKKSRLMKKLARKK